MSIELEDCLNIDDSMTMNLIVDAAVNHGIPSDFLSNDYPRLRKNRDKNPMVVITGASRTGATLLGNSLAHISKLNMFRLSASYFNNETDLYLPALCIADRDRCLSILHMRATLPNCAWIRLFGIKVIISVRNIYDLVANITQYIRASESHPNFKDGYASASMMWFDFNQIKLSDEELMDMVVDLYIPWIIQFYVSWYTVTKRNEVDAIWVDFHELKKNTDETIDKVMEFCNLETYVSREKWSDVYEMFPPSFQDDKRTHRADTPNEYWKNLVQDKHINAIKKYSSYYPEVNFKMIGI